MKNMKTFTSFINEELKAEDKSFDILDDCVKGTWEIVDDKINITGDFLANGKISGDSVLPLEFGKVSGEFDISNNRITSLEGCPEEAEVFNCSMNLLESLEDGPKKCKYYLCSNNYIKSLDGLPDNLHTLSASGNSITSLIALGGKKLEGDVFLNENFITSLEGCPEEVGGTLLLGECTLKSLDGCASKVGKNFDCSMNSLKTLEGGPEYVGGYYDCSGNELVNMTGMSENVVRWIDASNNRLSSIIGIEKQKAGNKINLSGNNTPSDLLRSQKDYTLKSNNPSMSDWFKWALKTITNSLMSYLNSSNKKEGVFKLLDDVDMIEIANDDEKSLAPFIERVKPDSAAMEYIRSKKDKISDDFMETLGISTDLKI